ncbi:thiamine diphosphate-binding protein [Xylariaceae sp. FL1019]|nr:thiamine diphosphate-binding protein [Xylariaceae sp. FL1019]
MAKTIKLADYLFARLKQLGVLAVHGVPGDFNLTLLDFVEPAGLLWVGNANELNAGYAADGYARMKGIGALITTFGVGELSAINAIAGAYAERAPVVHIVGTPDRATQDGRRHVHHTFNDGEFGRFAKMAVHVTAAQTDLRDPRTSPEQIDHVLLQCILQSRPVYISIPVDMVGAPVAADRLEQVPVCRPLTVPTPYNTGVVDTILEKIYGAKQPMILIDGETRALGIMSDVQQLVNITGWPTWLTAFSWGLVDQTGRNVHGIWKGMFDDEKVKTFANDVDLILCFGPHFSTTNSYSQSAMPKAHQNVIYVSDTEIRLQAQDEQILRDIPATFLMSQLLEKLNPERAASCYSTTYPDLPNQQSNSTVSDISCEDDAGITQASFWPMIEGIVQKGDILLGETGSAGHGCRVFSLPENVRTFLPVTWLSIGYMLGATQGAALALREMQKGGRAILFIGDGSFQMTVQELGTIIRHNLDVTVILLNNDGYTIERVIHGLRQKYNDVAPWRYTEAPSFFGANDTFTATARTCGELKQILQSGELTKGPGLKFLEVIMEREDVPKGPLQWLLDRQIEKEASAK